MKTASETFDHSPFGICVVDLDEGIVYQNESCRTLCNCPLRPDASYDEVQRICPVARLVRQFGKNGLNVLRGQEVGSTFCDVVSIREGSRDHVFLFPLTAKIEGVTKKVDGRVFTPRELEIIAMLVAKMSNERIRQALSISHNTLRGHLKNIYRKMPEASRKLLDRPGGETQG